MPRFFVVVLVLLHVPLLIGCDENERQLRGWQQEQVDQLQRQSQENAAAAKALVEADAASRQQFVALEQAFQTERQSLADQYTTLDGDRKALDALRQRLPLVATMLQGLAALVLGITALWICGRLLGRVASDDGAAELEETLILSITGESELLADTAPHTSLPSNNELRSNVPALPQAESAELPELESE